MHYGKIDPNDIANGPGVRVTLFVSGCTNRCKNCFQPQTWDFTYGQEFTKQTAAYLLEMLSRPYIRGLTILGGEPMEPCNQRALFTFLQEVRGKAPDKDIWCFTGFPYESLHAEDSHPRCEVTDSLLSMIDVLVDGRYEDDLKDISLRFRGSSNQRLIDVPKTITSRHIVLWNEIN